MLLDEVKLIIIPKHDSSKKLNKTIYQLSKAIKQKLIYLNETQSLFNILNFFKNYLLEDLTSFSKFSYSSKLAAAGENNIVCSIFLLFFISSSI